MVLLVLIFNESVRVKSALSIGAAGRARTIAEVEKKSIVVDFIWGISEIILDYISREFEHYYKEVVRKTDQIKTLSFIVIIRFCKILKIFKNIKICKFMVTNFWKISCRQINGTLGAMRSRKLLVIPLTLEYRLTKRNCFELYPWRSKADQ